MRKSYEFRLRPTKSQEKYLLKTLDACRFVYNWAIEDRKNLWHIAKCSTNYYDQAGYLSKFLKKDNIFLKEVHSHTLQNAIKRVDLAFQAFFRRSKKDGKSGYPRFKGKNWYDSFTFQEWGNGASFSGKRLRISKIGRIRIILHRPIDGEIKTCTIKRRTDGWYALFSVILPDHKPSEINNPVGIDVGLETFATLSTGEKIENPRFLKKAESSLKTAQRKVSRRTKGSIRRKKAVRHLRLEHLRLSRARKSFQFTQAHRLVSKFNPIFIENLKIKDMLQKGNRHLSKSISDASWGQFLGILSRSAESAGAAVIAVEARGTSQECSECGTIVPKKLSQRVHVCKCGYTASRDENAARNILKKGLGRPVGEEMRCQASSMNREAAGL